MVIVSLSPGISWPEHVSLRVVGRTLILWSQCLDNIDDYEKVQQKRHENIIEDGVQYIR